MLQDIVNAARTYDRPKTEEAVNSLTKSVRESGTLPDQRPLKEALTELRNNRWFDLLRSAGDALIQAGDTRASIRRLYAQSLIDSGIISAAIPLLERLIAEASGDERDDARGILGRAWKQAYVTDENLAKPLAKSLMERSVEQYYTPYAENREKNLYQGVNAVAMLARADRDGVVVSGRYPDYRELARTIRDAAKARNADAWDYAIVAEACVALEEWQEAMQWTERYVTDPGINAFSAAGTLRQFTEVWKLTGRGEGEGGPIIHLLEAWMLKREGGQSVDAAQANASLQALDKESGMLQAILGDEKYKTLDWYRTGLTRANIVALISLQGYRGLGTGFLIDIKGEQLLITNHHVIPDTISDITRAVVTFESLDQGKKKYRITEVLWTSPVKELDATIVRLDKEVKKVEAYPLCADLPDPKEKPRVYVIGHPGGGTLSFSIADNLLIDHLDPKVHYRAPTEPGSSGSPVFDSTWALLALHHAGDPQKMPKLHGKGTYGANEGFYFNAILEKFGKTRPRRKRT